MPTPVSVGIRRDKVVTDSVSLTLVPAGVGTMPQKVSKDEQGTQGGAYRSGPVRKHLLFGMEQSEGTSHACQPMEALLYLQAII